MRISDWSSDVCSSDLDLLKGIGAVGPGQGRPVVVMGERGLGKSHLMAALFHAVHDPVSTDTWLKTWAVTLGQPEIGQIHLRRSEERRVGKECVSKCSSRWSPYN